MNSITQVIRKVATAARKAVLLGALVGGVSMVSYATEVTETKAGPTIEKAQLETVDINLEAVVAAISKVDPDWVKGLPVVREVKPLPHTQTEYYYQYIGDDHLNPAIQDPDNWVLLGTSPSAIPCDGTDELMCAAKLQADEEELEDYIENLTFTQLLNDNRVETYREE